MRVSTRWLLALPLLSVIPAASADETVTLDTVEVFGKPPADLRLTRTTTVTSYNGTLLETTGIDTYTELAPLVPGLFISEQSVVTTSYNVRGVTTDDTDPRVTQRVAAFQDGVFLASAAGQNLALFDLERIDVLKGPQPVTFGRAAQIGAIQTVTHKADSTKSTELTAGFGDYNSRTASGFTNLPIIDGKLFARAAFTFDKADGYVDNLADGSTLQGRDTTAFRGSLRWQPSSATTADLIFNYQHDTPPGTAFKSMVIPTSAGDTNPYTAADLNRGRALGIDREIFAITGLVTHTLNENWTVTSTTGWRDIDAKEDADIDGSSFFAIEAGDYNRARQLSQDFRLSYDSGDRLTASIGAGAFWQKGSQAAPIQSNQQQLVFLFTGVFNPALPALYKETFTKYGETLSGDVFGDLNYKLTRRLTLGASLRVTEEKSTSGYRSLPGSTLGIPLLPTAGDGNSFFAPTGLIEADDDATSWVGGINANYEITPQHNAYASISRGRRPPSTTFSQDPTFTLISLEEEVVWNYEAGVKGYLANRRIAYGAAAFLYDYNHFQTQQGTFGSTIPIDGGRARGQGFETTLQGAVNDHLLLFGAYGFTDVEFAARDEDGTPQTYAGNTFRLIARHTFTLGATFTLPVDDVGTFFLTPTWEYKSEQFFEDDNANASTTAINPAVPLYSLRQGGYGLVNLRTGYRTPDNRWEVVFWVRNLLDKDYLIDAGNLGANFGFPTSTRGAPRMLGVQVTARF
jgi:iron complex outermembrane recepter protein